MRFNALLLVFPSFLWSLLARGELHSAPIVVPGSKITVATHYPISMYRLFKADSDGNAIAIPFQIDEINDQGDFVLPEGSHITANTGNGIFDQQDELVLMGDDVGPVRPPTKWPGIKPALLFEIQMINNGDSKGGDHQGAIYLAVYFQNPPPHSNKSYVTFDQKNAQILTSRYRYAFNQKNWLVSRSIDMRSSKDPGQNSPEFIPLIESTTFYMKADLKYFLTITANHRSIESELEAYKTGPIRTIVRISFHYNFLKLNFELGMYTEVSFFSNAIYLPAILYNPLEGRKSLNDGSGFYYGMALKENPRSLSIDTNMPRYATSTMSRLFSTKKPVEDVYWLTASAPDRILYVEIAPSKEMKINGAVPQLYQENVDGSVAQKRDNDQPSQLGEGPVNMALYFDLTKFSEGEHIMAFRLFFENGQNMSKLDAFRNLPNWQYSAQRVRQ